MPVESSAVLLSRSAPQKYSLIFPLKYIIDRSWGYLIAMPELYTIPVILI